MPATETKFQSSSFYTQSDLIDFLDDKFRLDVLGKLPEDPDRWIDELGIIHGMLTKAPLVESHIDRPPLDDPEFQDLGNGCYRYKGELVRKRGLWIARPTQTFDFKTHEMVDSTNWAQYRMGNTARLYLNEEWSGVPPETFYPENFLPKAQEVKTDKRPILTFDVNKDNQVVKVYAKGSNLLYGYFTKRPSYRLTNIASIHKTTSEEEMNRMLRLAENGVKTPEVVGYFSCLTEDFLFMSEVRGQNPEQAIDEHRPTIIEQDAHMLATLCRLGYRKVGFEDFADKVFDGQNLYLIDTDELVDIYQIYSVNYRDLLLDPTNSTTLRDFRKLQKQIFTQALKDALFKYGDSLTPTREDKLKYAGHFFQTLGWRLSKTKAKQLVNFPDSYLTMDAYMCMVTED